MTRPLQPHPTERAGLIAQVLETIREALAEAQQHTMWYSAVQGQRNQTIQGGIGYTFQLESDWEPPPNVPVQIASDPYDLTSATHGTLLEVRNTRIVLVTEKPLPQTALVQVYMSEATDHFLEQLYRALLPLQEQQGPSVHLQNMLFGFLPCSETRGERRVPLTTFSPDADQARALAIGVQSERLLVLGPAGTGKTLTACALALEYLQAGKTVLLVAPNETTLDGTMKRLLHFREHSSLIASLKEHDLVHVGVTTHPRDERHHTITLQDIVDQQLGTLARERDQLQQEVSDVQYMVARGDDRHRKRQEQWRQQRDTLQAHLTAAQQEREHLEALERQRHLRLATRLAAIAQEQDRGREQQKTAEQSAQALAAALPELRATCKACEPQLRFKQSELLSYRDSSYATRLLFRLVGITEPSLKAEVEHCQRQLEAAHLAVTTQEQQRDAAYLLAFQIGTQLLTLEQEARQLVQEQEHVTNDAERLRTLTATIAQEMQSLRDGDSAIEQMKEETRQQRRHLDQVVAHLQRIEAKQHRITSQAIAQAKLIGTTPMGLLNHPSLQARCFDATILDDASMVSVAMTLLLAARTSHHFALFGDPLQQSPLISFPEKEKKSKRSEGYWLETDLLSHLGVAHLDAHAERQHVVFLSQQSRVHSEVVTPVSRFLYRGRLNTRLDPASVSLRLDPCPDWPLLLVDTGDVDQGKSDEQEKLCQAKQPPRSTSTYNLYHVRCVLQLVQLHLAQLPDREHPQIGVITPYEAQKEKIEHALQTRGLLSLVHVGTVRSFQYATYPCVIFDTTEGYGVPVGQCTSNAWGRHGIPHGATRLIATVHASARQKLIYVANVDYITQRSLPQEKRYRQNHLLTHFVISILQQRSIASQHLFSLTSPRRPSPRLIRKKS